MFERLFACFRLYACSKTGKKTHNQLVPFRGLIPILQGKRLDHVRCERHGSRYTRCSKSFSIQMISDAPESLSPLENAVRGKEVESCYVGGNSTLKIRISKFQLSFPSHVAGVVAQLLCLFPSLLISPITSIARKNLGFQDGGA